MTSETRATSAFQTVGWVVVSQLLFIRAGLALFARQALRPASGGTIFQALYVAASWFYVMGLIGSVVLSMGWFVGWLYVRLRAPVMNRKLPVQLESPEFNETWPQAARTVYEGIVIAKMTRACHEFLTLEYCRPGRTHASVLLEECAFRSKEAMANQA